MTSRNFFQLIAKIIRFLPRSRRLPLRYWISELSGAREVELNHIETFVRGRSTAIDIGANEGLYTYRMAGIFEEVYSFDANPEVIKDIEGYANKRVKLFNKGLSSSSKTLTLYIPLLNGFALTGWASFDPENFPGAQGHIKKEIEVMPLDDLNIQNVSFIKIDVEGHELEVLIGAKKTIIASQPVLLIEIQEENYNSVAELLGDIGYSHRDLNQYAKVNGSEGNHIFVPVNSVG